MKAYRAKAVHCARRGEPIETMVVSGAHRSHRELAHVPDER